MRFFFYGTLIDAEVRRAVLGPHAPHEIDAARLEGWRRVPVPGKAYPTIVSDPGAAVDGVLARGLGPVARRLLERYEDEDLYDLVEVELSPAGRRRPVAAFVFAARPALQLRRFGTWDLEQWRRRDKRRLLLRLTRRSAA